MAASPLYPLLLSVLLAICACPGCQTRGNGLETSASWPTPRELRESMRRQGRLAVVYGSADTAAARRYRQLFDGMAARSQRLRIRVWSDTEAPADSLAAMPVMLAGSFRSNRYFAAWAAQLPFRPEADGFQFLGRQFSRPDQLLQLTACPNPQQPQQPLSILFANTDSALLHRLEAGSSGWGGIWRSAWSYEVTQGSSRLMAGQYSDAWQPDSVLHWDFTESAASALKSPHFRLAAHGAGLAPDAMRLLLDSLEAACSSAAGRLGRSAGDFSAEVHAYGSAELMGLMTQRMEQDFADPQRGAIHLLAGAAWQGLPPAAPAALLLAQTLGEPAAPQLLDGMSVWLTPGWLREGWAYWAARLAVSHNTLTLEELFSEAAAQTESPYVLSAMAAAFCDWQIREQGQEVFLAGWKSWQPDPDKLGSLEPGWQRYLAGLEVREPRHTPPRSLPAWHKGMTLAHEGYAIYNGYGSGMSAHMTAEFRQLGGNALAIVPYSGSRNVRTPEAFRIFNGAGGENDAAVADAMMQARQMGMRVLLKPQIWFSGAWPGDVDMQSEADWQAFFAHYRRWIRHYAILGELHGADLFCAGVEFVHATRKHPAAWAQLIRDLRLLYTGPITYAANWGEEFEQLAFAAELDYVGINCYYPLSMQDSASLEELKAGFRPIAERIAAKAAQTGKPLLFTEIGFRSVSTPWKNPHAEAQGRAVNQAHQARCYQAVCEVLRDAPWCRGTYWWKWPSYAAYVDEDPECFTPYSKPAQEVLQRFYQGLP
ncbi:MAG: hypothetical protein NW241_13700 [Bacteroidia bacterium]|nr:hypothetical protein [Bacteroidia bacterium]